MSKELSKEEILGALVGKYFDDLEFLEIINNMTYSRKVQLKRNNLTNEQNERRMDQNSQANI